MAQEQEGKAENSFKNFGKRVDGFLDELDEAGERLRKEFQQKYEELKVAAERMKNESGNKERWKEVEKNLQEAGDRLKKAFEAAFRREEKKGDQQ